jgi:hypothetical protein
MAGGVGFIRVKLLQVEKGSSMESNTEMFDPYVEITCVAIVQLIDLRPTGGWKHSIFPKKKLEN